MNVFNLKKSDPDRLDPRTVANIQQIYLPPPVRLGDSNYWPRLEQRIMSRLSAPRGFAAPIQQPWWLVLEGWSRAGLIAAGITLAVGAALLQNQGSDETAAAYEYIAAAAPSEPLASPLPLEMVSEAEPGAQRDAVLSYVLAR